jgi:hypothetical protein
MQRQFGLLSNTICHDTGCIMSDSPGNHSGSRVWLRNASLAKPRPPSYTISTPESLLTLVRVSWFCWTEYLVRPVHGETQSPWFVSSEQRALIPELRALKRTSRRSPRCAKRRHKRRRADSDDWQRTCKSGRTCYRPLGGRSCPDDSCTSRCSTGLLNTSNRRRQVARGAQLRRCSV